MIDPRFQEISEFLDDAIQAQVIGDEQTIIESLYRVREIAWSVNADILQGRWLRRHHIPQSPRISSAPTHSRATLDDLLL